MASSMFNDQHFYALTHVFMHFITKPIFRFVFICMEKFVLILFGYGCEDYVSIIIRLVVY
jgi:hypothetical protein